MSTSARPRLADYLPAPGATPDVILGRFLEWVAAMGFDLFAAQEEALVELMADRHVILQTPTGSGKSLVALGLHFRALAEGKISWYTSPIKALASEKFFDLCDLFGAERVGMSTGDATINAGAGVVCATAEVLSNMALRQGELLAADSAVLDEFHFYSDADRGVAWQVPLLALRHTQFLLMSATLGDVTGLARRIEERTGRAVAHVQSDERPVPLDFEWAETPLQHTIEDLVAEGRSPIYVVSFTQRECAELAQSLTSHHLQSKEQKAKIAERLVGVRFDTPYGKELRRFLRFGIGVHHAGLLPKYRLLVEQLSQDGLLSVVCGTDTLGVGVNIPIRTVLFSTLVKFDGEKSTILKVRDFKQIAGRAGRKGFDDRGSVVCQAPPEVVERRQRGKKGGKRKPPPRRPGTPTWTEETFASLIKRPPETLRSRFRISHGMILQLIQRDAEIDRPGDRNFASLRDLIGACHETEGSRAGFLHEAAVLVRSLHRAGILRMVPDTQTAYRWVVVDENLQLEFSLHQALSLYLVETIIRLDPDGESYPLLVLSLTEAILENPRALLYRQIDREKDRLVAEWKAEGVPWEERMRRLEEVTQPMPEADFIQGSFAGFCQLHPWLAKEEIRPKSIGREMWEGAFGFNDYVRELGIQRSEGLLLRYLSQLYRTLAQNVPAPAKTEAVLDVEGYFRSLIERVDTSLLEEWESLLHPEIAAVAVSDRHELHLTLELAELLGDVRALASRVRAEVHQLLRAVSARDWEEAAGRVTAPAETEPWSPERLEEAFAPFFAARESLVLDHEARLADKTRLTKIAERHWSALQVLVDPARENDWFLEAEIDLRRRDALEGPLLRLVRVAS